MNELEDQFEIIFSRNFCKQFPRVYLRSLSPLEKIEKLVQLQEQSYQMLLIREQNTSRPIPEKWRKWYRARFGNV